jgi:phosphoribosylaminoimidazole (AIR) synthetase
VETNSTTIVFELSNVEFNKVFDLIQKKFGTKGEKPKNTFNITIGGVDIVFNTNNA